MAEQRECTGKSVTKRTLRASDDTTLDATTAITTTYKDGGDVNVYLADTKLRLPQTALVGENIGDTGRHAGGEIRPGGFNPRTIYWLSRWG